MHICMRLSKRARSDSSREQRRSRQPDVEQVLRNRDQVVIDARHFLLANFQGSFGRGLIKTRQTWSGYM